MITAERSETRIPISATIILVQTRQSCILWSESAHHSLEHLHMVTERLKNKK